MTRHSTFTGLLSALTGAEPARPLVTFYDDSTGERVELSVATYANWVAKTANLLQDEFDVGPGSTVAVALPVHWQTAAVLLGVWSCGAAVLDTAAEDDGRLALEGERRRIAEERLDLLHERVLEPARHSARLEPLDELRRRGNADVAADERLLETLPRLVVGGLERGRGELGGKRAPALGERLAHAPEEARALGLVGLCELIAEKLGPGVAHAVAARGCCWGSRRDTTCDTPSGPIVTP